ncbi:MAG: hypothetical protein RSD97_05840 [Lachnospiraceae bacterium]
MYLIDKNTGKEIYYEKGNQGEVGSNKMFEKLAKAEKNSVITIHNHDDSNIFSLIDFNTNLKEDAIYSAIASGHDGRIVCVANQTRKMKYRNAITEAEEIYRAEIIETLIKQMKDSTLNIAGFGKSKEEKLSEKLAIDYFEYYRR